MCNGNSSDRPILNDDISDLFGGESTAFAPLTPLAHVIGEVKNLGDALIDEVALWTEKCKPCCGTGTFYSWAGRPVGPCRKCNGRGSNVFKTSPAQRDKAKQRFDDKKKADSAQAASNASMWIENHPAEYAWMRANANFEFAVSVLQSLQKYGELTKGQLNAVRRCVARNEQRAAEKTVQIADTAAAAPSCSVAKIEEAFVVAVGNGVKRPKLRLDTFIFSLAPSNGNNAGATYVVEASTKNYLGKVVDGKFIRVRSNCTEEQEAAVVAAASDPEASARAYGQRTGNCSVCGRGLTVNESIDLMMGPICAERYGW